jgi:hypothetical protein
VPAADQPLDEEIQEANDQLAEGLKSCRLMVNDYRAMLTGDQGDNDNASVGGYSSEQRSSQS